MIDNVASYSALFLAIATAAGTVIVSWRNRKTRAESQAAALLTKREADKLAAEEEQITVAAAERVVGMLRGELDRKDKTIGRQGREISALRRWIHEARAKFAERGFTDLPPVPEKEED